MEKSSGIDQKVFSMLGSFRSVEDAMQCAGTGRSRQQRDPALNAVSNSDEQCGKKCPRVGRWHKCDGGDQLIPNCIEGPLHRRKHMPGV